MFVLRNFRKFINVRFVLCSGNTRAIWLIGHRLNFQTCVTIYFLVLDKNNSIKNIIEEITSPSSSISKDTKR